MLTLVGPLPEILPALVATALSLFVISWALIKQRLLQVGPTLVWSALMLIPFILVSGDFALPALWPQALGIAIVSVALAAGDMVGVHLGPTGTMNKEATTQAIQEKDGNRWPIFVLLLVIFLIPVYHVIKAGNVPMVDFLSGGATRTENALSREAFAKLLPEPQIVKYAFNWVLSVLGPFLIALLVRRGWFFAAAAVFAWLVIYSIASMARAPLLIFVILTALACSFALPSWTRTAARWTTIGVFGVFVASSVFRIDQLVDHHNAVGISSPAYTAFMQRHADQAPIQSFTVADADRLRDVDATGFALRTYQYTVYRVFMTPIDVSHRWYAYYGHIADDWRPLSEIVGQRPSGQMHAANQVGTWAYQQRFPDKYLDSVSAYGSVDADAYAFGGIPAVILAALGLLVLRLTAAFLPEGKPEFITSAIIIGQLSLFTTSASLQAILVAQGLGLLLVAATWFGAAKRMRGGANREAPENDANVPI